MRCSKKSQISFEYLMLLSFTLLILIPAIYLFYNQTQQTSINVLYAEIDKIGKTVVNSARQIYFLGEHSKVVLEITAPENIRRIYTLGDKELVITFATSSGEEEFVFFSKQVTNITSNYSYPTGGATAKSLSNSTLRGGLLKISVESKGDYVLLNLV